jgi:hypothetical protein
MIACDRCENWFHPDCLKFTGSIDLVDQFICPTCESGKSLLISPLSVQANEIIDPIERRDD